jgi:hypothetical protein
MRVPPRWWTQLLRPPDPPVIRDQDLRAWRARFPETVPIADLAPRRAGTVVGVVARILVGADGPLEATVEDGSGELTAAFHGRRSLPGVELGRALRLAGVVAVDAEGRRRMRDPAWEPVAEPYRRSRSSPNVATGQPGADHTGGHR